MRAGALDAISQQAFGILTSSKLAGALNFKLEEHALRMRCGISDAATPAYGGTELVKQFTAADRITRSTIAVRSEN